MKTQLNVATWNRKEHFELFNSFQEPMYSITVPIDCTQAYQKAKELRVSFFLYYLYQSMAAAIATEPFRYRIENNNEVWLHNSISAGPTVMRDNGTFGFVCLPFQPTIKEFVAMANQEIDKVKQSTSLFPPYIAENIIHYSALPWLNFTSLSHARNFLINDGVPKISFGKVTEQNKQKSFPVSITVHHGLVDGIHVGQYVECYQQLLNQ